MAKSQEILKVLKMKQEQVYRMHSLSRHLPHLQRDGPLTGLITPTFTNMEERDCEDEEEDEEEKENQRGRKNHTTTYLFVSDSKMLGCVIA